MKFKISLLAMALVLAACGTAKKKRTSDPYSDQVSSSGNDSLKVQGESDKSSAGDLRTVYFAYDSANLSSQAEDVLNGNADFLKKNRNINVQIEGHCDERGGIQYNLALGQKRAKAVRNYLIGRGVRSSQLDTVSYGKERPLEFGHTEGVWSKNRRANFVVTSM